MPDEHSNLNTPAAASAARPPAGRRRGRRGGRGRVRAPRPATGGKPIAGETAPEMESPEMSPNQPESMEAETDTSDTSGGFREPHPEEPTTAEGDHFSAAESQADASPDAAAEPVQEPGPARAPIQPERREHHNRPDHPDRREHSERRERPERLERRPEPARPKPWTKPADFRPADTSAIHQAVLHATEIAETLKHTMDQLEEVLELVELAERQKLADEREIDELHRALRRIQPPRQQPPPQQYSRDPRRDEPRRDEPRRDEPRRNDPSRGNRSQRQPQSQPSDSGHSQEAPPSRPEAPPESRNPEE